MNNITEFIASKDFWFFHGWGLTTAWLVFSFLGILVKKLLRGNVGLYLHIFLFFINNAATYFLAGSAIYRLYPHLYKFFDWSLLKQGHIVGGNNILSNLGSLFLVIVLFQHIGGIAAMSGANGAKHRGFGLTLATIMKFIVVAGWLLVKNQ
jgi:hypothetical protein